MEVLVAGREETFISQNLQDYFRDRGHKVTLYGREKEGKKFDVTYFISSEFESYFILDHIGAASRLSDKTVLINPCLGEKECHFDVKNHREVAAAYAELYLKGNNFNYSVVRLPKNLIGAKYMGEGLVYNWIVDCLNLRGIKVKDDGRADIQFSSIESALPVLEKLSGEIGGGETYNLGNSNTFKTNYVANLVLRAGQVRGFKTYVDCQYSNSNYEYVDFSKAEEQLGYKDNMNIYELIEEAFSRIENGE